MLKLITLLLTSSMTVMAGATISPALPLISNHFAEVPNGVFWVKLMLTIPALFTALSAPIAGSFIDRVGRKPLLLAATGVYGLAGSSGLVLNSMVGLLIGRALLGVAVAGIMTTSTALIADYYEGVKRNQVMGWQAGFMGFGGVVFLVLGGLLADVGWRFPFAIYLLAWVAMLLVAIAITEPQITAPAVAGVVDTPAAEPLPQRTLLVIYGLTFLAMLAFYLVPVQLPFYLIGLTAGAVSNAQVGVALAALTLASAVMALFYKSIRQGLSFTQILVGVFGFMGVGLGLMAIAPGYSVVLAGTLSFGVGLGLLLPNMNVWLSAIVPPAQRGRALGGLTTCMFLGQFCSPIAGQPLIQTLGLAGTFGSVAIGLGILAAILWGITQTSLPPTARS